MGEQLAREGLPVLWERKKLAYTRPAFKAKYTPDFEIVPGLFIETKGIFDVEDRQKMLLVRDQNPGIEIRFVFSRSASPIYKGSPTTYAMWCQKHGFKYADKSLPAAWVTEFRTLVAKAKPKP